MNINDLKSGYFFTTNGKDIWKILYYYDAPSCRLKNLETGVEVSFGIGGLRAKSYHKIKMPKEATGE